MLTSPEPDRPSLLRLYAYPNSYPRNFLVLNVNRAPSRNPSPTLYWADESVADADPNLLLLKRDSPNVTDNSPLCAGHRAVKERNRKAREASFMVVSGYAARYLSRHAVEQK